MSFAVIADVIKRAVASLLVIFNCLPTAVFVKCKDKADDGGSVGEQSAQLEQIMKKYADDGMSILFISGHMHAIDENSFESDGSVYYLNLPSFQYDNGIGYTMTVFEGRIDLQAVSFLDGEEINGYKFTIEL